MHVKTNIEHNIIQVAILAICPLLLVVDNIYQALFYMMATTICFVVSSIVCFIFSKYLSRNIKIFVTAILSTFIITIINVIFKKVSFWDLNSENYYFFAVLTTICLCIDIYFIETKAVVPHYLPKVVMDCVTFSVLLFVYTFVLEFLSAGTMFGKQLSQNFAGIKFFGSITFKFIWLGIICIIADAIYRIYMKKADKKRITYQKYVKKIREEKEFQYNDLYRKRLLSSDVEIKNVNEEKAEEIQQKTSENVSSNELLKKEEELAEPVDDNKNKKDKKSKIKKSKKAKVEKLVDIKNSEGDEN